MRFDLTKALTRRILNGDITIDREGPRYYTAYDSIKVNRIGDRLVVALFANGVALAEMDADIRGFFDGKTITIDHLEGRMELHAESNPYDPYLPR